MAEWKPFQKGNTLGSGRPARTAEMRKAEALMKDKSEKGAQDLIDLSEVAVDEAVRARLLCFRWEAVFGKAPQAITGGDGEPLIPSVDLSRLTDDQLRTIVAVGRAIATLPGESGGSGDDVAPEGEGVAPDSAT